MKVLRRLNAEQQEMALSVIGRVCKVAHVVWRKSNMPARYWDELRSEALLEACACAARYRPGETSFADVAAFQVRKRLWKCVQRWRGIEEFLGDDDCYIVEALPEESAAEDLLISLLPSLPERQRQVLELRYGLSGEAAMTHKEIAERCNLVKQTVFGAEQRGLANLRKATRGGLKSGMSVGEIRETLTTTRIV